jgi:hypothetical protein
MPSDYSHDNLRIVNNFEKKSSQNICRVQTIWLFLTIKQLINKQNNIMGKTVVEKQIQAYGEFQREIKSMNREQRENYATQGSADHDRLLAKRAKIEERDTIRAKKIADFDKTRPNFSTRGITPEQMKQCMDDLKTWEKSRRDFLAKLNAEYPDLRN